MYMSHIVALAKIAESFANAITPPDSKNYLLAIIIFLYREFPIA